MSIRLSLTLVSIAVTIALTLILDLLLEKDTKLKKELAKFYSENHECLKVSLFCYICS